MVARDSILSAFGGIVHIGLCFIGFTISLSAVISGGRLLSALCGTTQKESFSDDCFCACYLSQHLLHFGNIGNSTLMSPGSCQLARVYGIEFITEQCFTAVKPWVESCEVPSLAVGSRSFDQGPRSQSTRLNPIR